jgi:predicted aspartyl protease
LFKQVCHLEALGAVVVSVLLTYYAPAWSQILRYQGADGRIYFTYIPPPSQVQPQHEVDNAGSATEEIPLRRVGGVYELPVEINGVLTLHFTVDTGASEVNIPADVVRTLYRAGTIQDTDFLPGKTYVLADGSTMRSARFLLRSLKIGSHRITNVPASIGPLNSHLLLGQNVLEKLGTWGIDSQRKVLMVGAKVRKGQPIPPTTLSATIIRQAQERLQAAGFDPGPTDGVLGMRTREALLGYQRAYNLPVTGSPDKATLEALGVQ